MLKWSLRVIVTALFIALLGTCWWVYHLPPHELVVKAEDVPVAQIESMLQATGYDDDDGILNEDPKK